MGALVLHVENDECENLGTNPSDWSSVANRVRGALRSDAERPQFGLPRFAVRPHQHRGSFRIADDFLFRRIPANLAAGLQGNVCQVTHRRHAMAALQIGVWFLARLQAVEKIADVPDVLVFPIARSVFRRLGPVLLARVWQWLRS